MNVNVRAYSHQAKARAKAKKTKEPAKEIKKINDKHQKKFLFRLLAMFVLEITNSS